MWAVKIFKTYYISNAVCTALRTHPNPCVAGLNCLKNSSCIYLLLSLLQYPLRPVWCLPPPTPRRSLPRPGADGGTPAAGWTRPWLSVLPCPLFSPSPGSLQRDVVSGASSRSDGTVTDTAVSGRAERRAECAPDSLVLCTRMGCVPLTLRQSLNKLATPQLRCTISTCYKWMKLPVETMT